MDPSAANIPPRFGIGEPDITPGATPPHSPDRPPPAEEPYHDGT